MNISRSLCASLIIASLTACGGGGGGDSSPPPASVAPPDDTASFVGAVVSPTSMFATQQDVTLTISGASNLLTGLSSSLIVKLNGTACGYASIDYPAGTSLTVSCDAPATPGTATLQFFVGTTELSSSGITVSVIDPDTQPAPAFTTPTLTGSATWGQSNATILVTGGQNLFGRTFSATVDGNPCYSAVADTIDLSRLKLRCNTPPGGSGSTPVKVVVKHEGNDLTAGGISHTFATCAASGISFDGVTLPRLCNADAGSLAAKRIDTIGIWKDTFGNPMLLAPTGRFLAAQLIGFRGGDIAFSNGTWQMSNAEYLSSSASTSNLNGTHVPFVTIDASEGTFDFDNYDPANALAVNQGSLTGQWGNSGTPLSLTIAANGDFTGTTSGTDLGTCSLTGSIKEAQAGTQHNIFTLQMKAAISSSCELLQNVTVPGLVSLLVANRGTSIAPDYKLVLTLMAHQPASFYMTAYADRQ